ncbi:MAG TPA: alpha/beta hydrolase-fold protein [Thermoleophilia bacterium]|nr:alpha/beta hydrolase-fold protein [Thermoleophilia bacterium]
MTAPGGSGLEDVAGTGRGSQGPAEAGRDPEAGVTRRQFLIGGGVVAAGAVLGGVVGWRSWTVRGYYYRLTGAYGEPGTPPPSYPVTYQQGSLPSLYLTEPAVHDIAYPPGVDPSDRNALGSLPVLVCLPGRGRSPGELLQGQLQFGDYVADAIEKRGVTPFAVAAVQASDTYWHKRAAGDDAMAMLHWEFLPYLRGLGLGGPTAIMGWSMGGYGALLAAELHPDEFCGACGVSPALWRSFDDGVGDAFDSAADYAHNDVFRHVDRLRGLPVRIDCGRQDPFYGADEAFTAALLRPPAGGFTPGGHNDDYWSRVAPAEIDWLGAQFEGARRPVSPAPKVAPSVGPMAPTPGVD